MHLLKLSNIVIDSKNLKTRMYLDNIIFKNKIINFETYYWKFEVHINHLKI